MERKCHSRTMDYVLAINKHRNEKRQLQCRIIMVDVFDTCTSSQGIHQVHCSTLTAFAILYMICIKKLNYILRRYAKVNLGCNEASTVERKGGKSGLLKSWTISISLLRIYCIIISYYIILISFCLFFILLMSEFVVKLLQK